MSNRLKHADSWHLLMYPFRKTRGDPWPFLPEVLFLDLKFILIRSLAIQKCLCFLTFVFKRPGVFLCWKSLLGGGNSNIFYVHPEPWKWSNLTNIFQPVGSFPGPQIGQMGWNIGNWIWEMTNGLKPPTSLPIYVSLFHFWLSMKLSSPFTLVRHDISRAGYGNNKKAGSGQ